ncbi:MAG TPA: hypothetical protein VKP88_05350, partial [Candidatus Paceibacterota bacterium]|nr:hypothetical protein [Candidatus Paceibacterota bacterium]
LHTTISDFDAGVQTNTLDSLAAPVASVDLNNQKITGLASPTSDTDAANKGYVDAARSGLDVKQSVRAATTGANINLTGTQTIDGVALIAGDRILVKDQTDKSENGVYVVASSAWSRSDDADEPSELNAGTFFFVEEGTDNADAGFVLSSDNPLTIGTDDLDFVQFSGAGQIVAGDGLTKDGNQIDVVGTADRITANADSIDIASTYAGQASIDTVGTITTGTWEGTEVAVAHGGTGATTAAGARANLSATTKYSETNTLLTPSSGVVTWTVTHNLGTSDVLVQVRDFSGGNTVEVDVTISDSNTVVLGWNSAVDVTADSYRVVVIG